MDGDRIVPGRREVRARKAQDVARVARLLPGPAGCRLSPGGELPVVLGHATKRGRDRDGPRRDRAPLAAPGARPGGGPDATVADASGGPRPGGVP